MNQVSRPMQIALGAVLVFAVLWFVALRPKEAAVEPVAATPATPAQTPAADAGGAQAQTGIGKTVEAAKNGAAAADAAVKAREGQTGEATAPAATPSTSSSTTASPAASASGSGAAGAPATPSTPAGKPKAEKTKVSAAQQRADDAILAIKDHLQARRAVVVLVWSPSGKEDKLLHRRIKRDINRRGGKVRTYFINVREVGRYDGLLSGLALSQTPSTIVIAPNNEAKVLGGLTSTERIDRLTSSALQAKAPATK